MCYGDTIMNCGGRDMVWFKLSITQKLLMLTCVCIQNQLHVLSFYRSGINRFNKIKSTLIIRLRIVQVFPF